MSKIKDKPGRRISLSILADHDRNLVHIHRKLHNTHGFVVDVGNMGWMPIPKFKKFVEDALIQASSRPRLVDIFGGK